MKRSIVVVVALTVCVATPSHAVTVEKREQYFTIASGSVKALDIDIRRVGPYNKITKNRTASSTSFTFSPKIVSVPGSRSCSGLTFNVSLKLNFIQPVWKPSVRPDEATRRAFDALRKDVRAFQTQQTRIAERSAKQLEDNLRKILAGPDCTNLRAKIRREYDRHNARHDQLQSALVRTWRQ